MSALCALAMPFVALAPADGAAPPNEQAAVGAVRALIFAQADKCQVTPENVSATPLVDPLKRDLVTGWQVVARVARFRGSSQYQTFATWEVEASAPTPVSPLAGMITRGCAARDPSAPGEPDDWRSLPYLDYASGAFYITTSTAWKGAERSIPTGAATFSLGSYPWG